MASFNPQLLEKISKLREYYTSKEDWEDLDRYEKRLRETITSQGINQMKPIIDIVTAGTRVIEDINNILQYDRKITDFERLTLFEKRDAYQFFINRLSGKYDNEAEISLSRMFDERIKKIEDSARGVS